MPLTSVHIRVMEPTTGKTFSVVVPKTADIAELRRRIAIALTTVMETCELYQERTGRLLPSAQSHSKTELIEGEVLRILPKRVL